ncbi:MAG TPA: DUF1330 domain-containing protein [Conexibacter sp.]|nr:DUF1330 domain-containing protein [Conexibacter sp.]
MDETTLPERPNEEGFAAFAQRAQQAGDGPVTMLNLLALKPDGGRERYEQYGAAVAPLLDRAGGRIVYAGEAVPPLLGDDCWDLVALVEYPSRQAFLDMVSSPDYLAIAHLRTEALTNGELHPLDTLVVTFDR